MFIPAFNFYKPVSVKDVTDLLEKRPNAAPMAGGTDLIVEIKNGIRSFDNIISLTNVEELKNIYDDEDNLYIGAAVTHSEIISSGIIKKIFPALPEACSKIGSEQVRNAGTIGGNLCTAASCCDTAPSLLAVNASVEITDSKETRTVSLKDFFIFNKKTILKKNELLLRVIIPKPLTGTAVHYEKFGLREAGSVAVVSVAAMIRLSGDICADACIVIGAVAPTPKISYLAGQIIKGGKISEMAEGSQVLEQASVAAVNDSIPIDDIRGGAQYRRDILKILTKRAIINATLKSK